jgi:ubiquinone/menaquinone biosynthesis C-methylase UbiE
MSKFDKTHSQDFIRRMDTEEKIAGMYMPYVEEIISQIGYSPETILDIGTGPGTVPMLLGEIFSGAKVFGIDSSKYMVSHANSKRMKKGLTNVVFEVGDGRALRWDDESFDLVLSKGVFKMIPNRHLFLKEMWRVLKSGKCAFISDLRRDGIEEFEQTSDSMPDDEKNKVRSALERSLTVDELRRILETSGLPLKPVITTRGYRFMVRLAKD